MKETDDYQIICNGDSPFHRDTVLERLVKTWSYKPRHRLELMVTKQDRNLHLDDYGRLRYCAFVQNVHDPELKHIIVSLDHPISNMEMMGSRSRDEGYWMHVICALIERMERHEMAEWLKFDGTHWRNPDHAHG